MINFYIALGGWASSFEEFIAMGKHGGYVWSSYAICGLVLLLMIVGYRYQLKSLRSQVKSRQQSKTDDKKSARRLLVEKQ